MVTPSVRLSSKRSLVITNQNACVAQATVYKTLLTQLVFFRF